MQGDYGPLSCSWSSGLCCSCQNKRSCSGQDIADHQRDGVGLGAVGKIPECEGIGRGGEGDGPSSSENQSVVILTCVGCVIDGEAADVDVASHVHGVGIRAGGGIGEYGDAVAAVHAVPGIGRGPSRGSSVPIRGAGGETRIRVVGLCRAGCGEGERRE